MAELRIGTDTIQGAYVGAAPLVAILVGDVLLWGSLDTVTFDFTGGTLDGASLTRSSAADYWTSAPDVDSAAADAAIFEYSVDGTQLLGLRVDPANTNLIAANRDLSTWTSTNVTPSSVVGVDGTGTPASTLTASSDDGTCYLAVSGLTIGQTYTLSANVKRRTGTGRVDLTVDGGTTLIDISAELLGGAWQRVTHQDGLTFVATGTSHTVGVKFATNTDAIDIDDVRLESGAVARGPLLAGGACAPDVLFLPDVDGGGYGYLFDWNDFPASALRDARWVEEVVFTAVVAGTSATATVTYRTQEPGNPQYTDQETVALSLPTGTFLVSGTVIVSGTIILH